MPRSPRVFLDGALYHVYGRTARSERIFAEDAEASRFVDVLHAIKRRDGLTVFAWCLMANHYHLALRTSTVPLWRTMRLIQWRFASEYNRRRWQLGPVWQGRYQVRMVEDQRHLLQLIAYVHLNPVAAGVVDDPARHRWSGHRELVGKGSRPLVDVDATLALFAGDRSNARRAYTRMLRSEREQAWIGEDGGQPPWWRRQPGEAIDSGGWDEPAGRQTVHDGSHAAGWKAAEYLVRASAILGVDSEALASRTKASDVVWLREIIALVGAERYGVRVNELARELEMNPGSVSRWISRAAERRRQDEEFAERCGELEERLGRE